MWYRSDFKAGFEANKAGPSCGSGWFPGHESSWHSSLPCSGGRICDGRRQSSVSDSGDTGIGTYCSDSLEDDSCSSATPLSSLLLSQHNLNQEEDGVPSALATSSASSSPRILLKMASPSHSPSCWNMSRNISKHATSSLEAPSSLDMKVHQPIRRSSSFTKLSSGVDKSSTKTSSYCYSPSAEGSLDRGVLHGYRKKRWDSNVNLYLPLSSTMNCSNILLRSPGAEPSYRYKQSNRSTGLNTNLAPSSSHSSPVKYSLSCSSFYESKDSGKGQQICGLHSSSWGDWPVAENPDTGIPIQPAVRTQMWLTEQMDYQPRLESGNEPGQASSPGTEDDGINSLTLSPQESGFNQMLMETSIPSNTLLKVKEKLLRERELEIQSQKQQIMQLHVWIRENEHRAQQVLGSQRGQFHTSIIPNTEESAMTTASKLQSDRRCCDEELSKKLAAAELEVLHLNLFFKQVTLKYTEEIRKLEEKIKTRDRYITSLKKKYQRESEQNQDKQQRIEILEKYLSDLPTLNEVQLQSKQKKLEEKNRRLEITVFQLQKSIEEGCALVKKKDVMIEMQAKTENEMMTSVQRLRKKVQQCLDDGARLPVQDLKNLLGENSQLLQQQDNSNMVLRIQKDEIERLTSQLMATSGRLLKKRGAAHPPVGCSQQKEENLVSMLRAFSQVSLSGTGVSNSSPQRLLSCSFYVPQDKDKSEVDELFKEMSLCLLDLQGFCSILAQRAQGKEPNLSLLLGMKSLSVSAEEQEHQLAGGEEEPSCKLLQVGLLKRGIDDLRRTVAEYCPQYVAPSCATQ
ncbi:centrosomal protein of 85 kDa-like isoform X2 [Poeciliopsis prolifica]|uniref:centrosomal protein of 85 kDa-like isoform X2 n=1 Tax=Poeciliopsis prolifica TaxID=188132 RepID=UPI0024135EAF|nr:centrosomal protein of 85 kDa-like isoform X2 [Poeciliopsis prolifica]